jgi:hypothetical protein
LGKVVSLDLVGGELKWFDRLCLYTDYYIDNFYDGRKVDISLEDMWVPDLKDKNRRINCGPHPHQIPHWRQGAVVKVWIKVYEDLDWKISPVGDDTWPSYNSKYKFEIDLSYVQYPFGFISLII